MIKPESFKLDETRQHLYFDEYKYRCSLAIGGIQYFRHTDVSDIEEQIEELTHQKWYGWRKPFDPQTADDIRKFISWRNSNITRSKNSEFKLVTGEDSINLYSNDITIIQSLAKAFEDCDIIETMKLSYATIRPDYDRSVIYRVNPKYQFRLYLRSRRYSSEEREELSEFLSENPVKLSNSLSHWLTSSNKNAYWAWDYLCFDYDDEYIATLLALKFDGVIRKICRIVQK